MFILPNLHTGGAERIITTISNHLSREKFIPSILLFQKEGGYLDFLKEDIEIIEIKTSSIRSSLFPILKTIWKRKPDIYHHLFRYLRGFSSFLVRRMLFLNMLQEKKSDFFINFTIILIKSLPKVMI